MRGRQTNLAEKRDSFFARVKAMHPAHAALARDFLKERGLLGGLDNWESVSIDALMNAFGKYLQPPENSGSLNSKSDYGDEILSLRNLRQSICAFEEQLAIGSAQPCQLQKEFVRNVVHQAATISHRWLKLPGV